MYGTVAHLKVIPGRRHELNELLDDRPVPVVAGWIANYLLEIDDDPDHAIFVSVFDSRESYHANAASSEQHERYRRLRERLTEDPAWTDGEIFPYMSFRQPPAESRLYGSVARMAVKPGARQALNDFLEAATVRFDQVRSMQAGYLVLAENDPDLAVMVGVFDSEEAYRANSESPEQHQRYLEMRSLLTQDPDWYNGYITSFLRF